MKIGGKQIAPTVVALGVVSLLTDMSSEMIYPLLPVFLAATLGAGPAVLGLIEGVAESTAALLKVFSGIWTDRTRRRKPLVVAGYSLSGMMRPLIGLATGWPAVLLLRFADRVGKGLRTSPRDALIADVTPPDSRGTAYGFHRAMDHTGAVIGPLVAAGLLKLAGFSMRTVFLLAIIPAVAVVLVLAMLKEAPPTARAAVKSNSGRLPAWKTLGPDYRRLLFAVFVFTMGNSTDAFLLLRLSKAGMGAAMIAILWAAHHVLKMVSNYLGGRLSDRFGPRRMIASGWLYYGIIYLAFAWLQSMPALIAVFLAYGIYFGFTEPSEKAWVSSMAPQEMRGAAFGWYHFVVGAASLPASIVFGLLWQKWGTAIAFTAGALLAVSAVALLPAQTRVNEEWE